MSGIGIRQKKWKLPFRASRKRNGKHCLDYNGEGNKSYYSRLRVSALVCRDSSG